MDNLIFIDASGFSMWPFLKSGEKLIIKKVSVKDLKIGDIILYRTREQLVCHRFVKKLNSEDGYLLYTRADASPNLDEAITEKMLIGKVTGILRKGRVINFMGRWRCFVNRLIVEFAPFLKIGIKLGKGPIIYVRSLVRRCRKFENKP